MKKNKVRKAVKLTILTILLLSGLSLLFLILIPRKYDAAEFTERPGTRFLTLSTGSKIGYFQIKATDTLQKLPIVYLHGGPGGRVTDLTIKNLAPLSADGHDLYFYDQIGSGHSARLENIREYTVERHKRDLEAFIKEIGASRIILIGHSWGSLLATQFLADNPEVVDKLILTGPGPILPIRQELRSMTPPDSLNLKQPATSNLVESKRAHDIRSKTITRWARYTGKKLASDKEADNFGSYLFTQLNKSAVFDADTERPPTTGVGYYAHVMTVATFNKAKDPRTALKNYPRSVLLMRGQYDNQKWGYLQEYLDLFSNDSLVIVPNSGHFIEADQPDTYTATIRRFLSDSPSP